MNKVNLEEFYNKYELIGSINLYEPIGECVCRFCGENSKDFFQTDSHIIPELLGENNFISKDECDKCNKFFSKYESQLAILARPYLTLTNVKTKKYTPSFQSRTDFQNQERTTIKIEPNSIQRVVVANKNDISIDKEKGILEIKLRNPGFKPIYVYKALCKIAFGIMPTSVVNENRDFFEWICGKKETLAISHGFRTVLNKKFFLTPSAMLYQAKQLVHDNREYPEFIGIICFANVVLQFYLPFSRKFHEIHSENRAATLIIYPGVVHDYDGFIKDKIPFTVTHMNLTDENIYKFDDKITFQTNEKKK